MMPRFLTLASGWREAAFALNGKPEEEVLLKKKSVLFMGRGQATFPVWV